MVPPETIVETNTWLNTTIGLTWRLILPGLAWCWIWPRLDDLDRNPWFRHVIATAQVIFNGLAISLGITLILIRLGRLDIISFAIVAGLASMVGLALGFLRHGRSLTARMRAAWPGLLICLAGFAAVMLYPRTGEWVVGGWDPGIYMNNGVAMSREGGHRLAASPAFTQLTRDELVSFTRIFNEKVYEVFPGVPIHPDTRDYQLYFFPLTSSWIAMLDQTGGLHAAVRVNLFTGWLHILLIPAVLLVHTRNLRYAILGASLLIFQPVWLYHLKVPTSEMLQLLLMAGIFFAIPYRESSWRITVFLGVYLVLAVINRLSFLPFGMVLALLLAWLDLARPQRARVWLEHLAYVSGLALGAWIDFLWSTSTIGRLGNVIPSLLGGSVLAGGGIIILNAIGHKPHWRAYATHWSCPIRRATGTSIVLFLALLWRGTPRFGLAPMSEAWQSMIPFFTPSMIAATILGLLALAWTRRREFETVSWLALFLAVCVIILLAQKHIAGLYPWATRRILTEFTLLLTLAPAFPVILLWSKRENLRGPWGRIAASLLVLLTVLPATRQAYRAWSQTEYDGISGALAQIAGRLHPDDIVVADHFKWGTSLALIHGRHVLNGERLWAKRDEYVIARGVEALRRMASEGRRIRFVTSTKAGLTLYRWPMDGIEPDWQAPPITHTEFIHHPRANTYAQRTNQVHFAIYTWHDAASPMD